MSYGIFGLIDAIEKFDLDRGLQVRDLRHRPDQGHHPRRAALDRLGAPLGAGQGPGARAGVRQARGPAAPHAHRRRAGRRARPHRRPAPDHARPDLLHRPRRPRRDALRRRPRRGDHPRRHPARRRAWARWRPTRSRRCASSSPTPSTASPSGRRWSSRLYYYEGLTLAEIGSILGVTESRVCQIHTKAVLQLRARMAASEREPA